MNLHQCPVCGSTGLIPIGKDPTTATKKRKGGYLIWECPNGHRVRQDALGGHVSEKGMFD